MRFDSAALQADARAIDDAMWTRHFNTALFEGDWSGVALRSNGGSAALYPDPYARGFADTPLLARCPAVREVLAAFHCEFTSVRFLRLGPGSRILEHQDYDLTREEGEARIHVCVQSNDGVTFELDGRPVDLAEGECWYLDVSRPHRAENRGESARIHLVVDCLINPWLERLLSA